MTLVSCDSVVLGGRLRWGISSLPSLACAMDGLGAWWPGALGALLEKGRPTTSSVHPWGLSRQREVTASGTQAPQTSPTWGVCGLRPQVSTGSTCLWEQRPSPLQPIIQ